MTRTGRVVLLSSALVMAWLNPPAAQAGQASGNGRTAAPMQAPADAKAFSPTLPSTDTTYAWPTWTYPRPSP